MIESILLGVGAEAIHAASGFLKNRKEQTFDAWRFTQAIAEGAVLGLIAGYLNVPADAAVTMPIVIGAKELLGNLFKAIKSAKSKPKKK